MARAKTTEALVLERHDALSKTGIALYATKKVPFKARDGSTWRKMRDAALRTLLPNGHRTPKKSVLVVPRSTYVGVVRLLFEVHYSSGHASPFVGTLSVEAFSCASLGAVPSSALIRKSATRTPVSATTCASVLCFAARKAIASAITSRIVIDVTNRSPRLFALSGECRA